MVIRKPIGNEELLMKMRSLQIVTMLRTLLINSELFGANNANIKQVIVIWFIVFASSHLTHY